MSDVVKSGRRDWWRFWVAHRPADPCTKGAAAVVVMVAGREMCLGVRLGRDGSAR